ncbi:MAG: helix-turn-helix transcriptional regulator [Streptosporangiaceae bacterium]
MGGVPGGAAGPLVGRDRELARVALLLDEALAGRGRLVLCTGEPGIGKTRLAEEITAEAAARGVLAAWARAADRDSSPPYGLWRLALDEPAVRAGTGPWARAASGPALPGDGEASSAQRFALFAAVRQHLTRAAEPSGLLLVLDDLQWADEASLVLLADLVRQLRGPRILLFATCRDAPRPGHPASRTLLQLATDANTERIALHGLPAGPVGELLRAAGLAASPEQAADVHAETGGNPFLVREMAHMLAQRRDTAQRDTVPGEVPGEVPGRVLEATAYRLTQLPGPAQELLRAAAVTGQSFSAGVVARMLDVPVLSLLGPLDECAAAGFLVPGGRPGDHRFAHALLRSAVAAQLSTADQRRLHTAAADAIEGLYQGEVRLHLTEIARHRVAGSWPGDRARAVAACEAAAGVASDALAFEEAARLYRQALDAGAGEISEADRDRLELGLAAALFRSGDLPGWHETASRVARRAEQRQDRLTLAAVALVMEGTGEIEWDAELGRVCEQALADGILPAGLRARVSSRYAQALVYGAEYQRAGTVSRDALAVAEASGDPVALVDALRARQLACSGPEGVAERTRLAHRMLGTADQAGSAWAEMWARLWRIDTLFETGQLKSVQRELADLDVCLERVPGPIGTWHWTNCAATLAVATGRFSEAKRLAADSFKVFSDMGHPVAFGAYSVILGQVAMHTGADQSGLAELFTHLPDRFKPDVVDTTRGVATVFPALTQALICLDQGDRAGAEVAYAHAGPVRSWTPTPALGLSCWGHGLLVAIRLGRAADIEFLAAQFEPFRGQHVANGAGAGVYMGPVELQTGRAAAALGRLDAAAADLDTAIASCAANGARGYRVQASVELAAVLAQRLQVAGRDRALAVLGSVADEAERLGMVPFSTRIGQLRAELNGSRAAAGPLSPREQEVARLVARGMTNKQIAAALYVSERTAENHVQHILTKLGFSNRSQIAAWSTAEPGP